MCTQWGGTTWSTEEEDSRRSGRVTVREELFKPWRRKDFVMGFFLKQQYEQQCAVWQQQNLIYRHMDSLHIFSKADGQKDSVRKFACLNFERPKKKKRKENTNYSDSSFIVWLHMLWPLVWLSKLGLKSQWYFRDDEGNWMLMLLLLCLHFVASAPRKNSGSKRAWLKLCFFLIHYGNINVILSNNSRAVGNGWSICLESKMILLARAYF